MTNPFSMPLATGVLALLVTAASPAQAPQSQVLTLASPNEELRGHFGTSVAGVGDVNRDGIPDLIVGASEEDPGDSPTDAGRAYVLSGEDGSLLLELVSPNEQSGGRFGSVASPGDVNQDGVPDLLVGAFEEFLTGRAYILNGQDGSLLFELVSPNEEGFGAFGGRLAGAGDVNEDGTLDVIVGAHGESPGGGAGNAGRAYVFSGQDGGLLFELASPNESNGGEFGLSVAGAGDVNRDGVADLIVGAPGENLENSLSVGTAYAFSGVDGSVLFRLASPDPQFNGRFGESVAGAGDANQDGFPDLIVGARRETRSGGPNGAGLAYVFSGKDASLLLQLASPNEESLGRFGASVASSGDVNGDAIPDLLVGAPDEDPGTSPDDAGRAYVFSGQDGSILFQLMSLDEEQNGFFGFLVRSAGDLNQDGSADLIVGAGNEDPGDSPEDAGRAYVFLSPYPLLINSGGPHYTDLDGSLFVADRAHAPGSFGYVGGVARHFDQPIGGTDDDLLYQDVRLARPGDSDGLFSYRFDVSPGRYDVTLYLMAPALDGPGNVVMDVRAEEDVVFDDLDVTAEAGGAYQALVKTFAVDVTDGTLVLRFRAENKAAVVSAIAVAAQTEARGFDSDASAVRE